MRDLKEWNAASDAHFAERSVVAFDLDDTLTEAGALPAEVVAALEKAQAAGWLTVLVTGRAAGWVDALIKLLPFDAVVGENGALLYFWPQRKAKRGEREECRKLYWSPQGYKAQAPGEEQRARFVAAGQKILSAFPGARIASDQPYRLYDLAIDFAEEVTPPLSLDEAWKIQALFTQLGATAKVSSIHVNGWWGNFSKVDGLRELLERHYGLSVEKNVVYCGDSPNDGPLFEFAGVSVGVANVREFIPADGKAAFALPKFVSAQKSARGALELLRALRPLR